MSNLEVIRFGKKRRRLDELLARSRFSTRPTIDMFAQLTASTQLDSFRSPSFFFLFLKLTQNKRGKDDELNTWLSIHLPPLFRECKCTELEI